MKTANLVRKNVLVVRVMQFVGALHCIFALLQVYWLMIVDKWVNYLKKCAWLFDEICFKMVSCFQHLAVVACRAATKASTTPDSWTSSPKMFRRNYIYLFIKVSEKSCSSRSLTWRVSLPYWFTPMHNSIVYKFHSMKNSVFKLNIIY